MAPDFTRKRAAPRVPKSRRRRRPLYDKGHFRPRADRGTTTGEAGSMRFLILAIAVLALVVGEAFGGIGRLVARDVPPALKVSAPGAAAAPASAGGARAETPGRPAPLRAAELREFPVPVRSHPHDVAPAPDGAVWYTAQTAGALGRLDPATGEARHIPLGRGSSPHGVIVGPDGAPWITDGGLDAIVRVDPATEEVQVFPLPPGRTGTDLNTAVFDRSGILWFTGQSGIYGRLDPATGALQVFDAPQGRGPYGITVTPDGSIYF